MRLAAIYIPAGELTHVFGDDHKGYTLNLGGRNIYDCYNDNEGITQVNTAVLNENFIEDLWGNEITQISAIVGANGTGKSSVLNIFRGHSFCSFVYENINDNHHEIIQVTHETQIINDFIYYSPHLNIEIQNYVIGNFNDLSKFEMILEDTDLEQGILPNLLELHDSENIKRWIKFIRTPGIDVSLNEIKLPVFEAIKIKLNSFDSRFNNTSNEFRPFFEEFNKIRSKERDFLYDEKRKIDEELNNSTKSKYYGNAIDLKLEVVSRVIDKVRNILESSGNKYLKEGEIYNALTIDSPEFANISTLKEAFYWFLENSFIQYSKQSDKIYFPVEPIKDFIETLLKYLPESDDEIENWTQFDVSFDQALDIINKYKRFIYSFNEDFSYDRKILLNFRPNKNLSSGEKSMYDLFSTLHDYQFKLDQGVIEEYNRYSKRTSSNDNYLLLLDEADLGFHPQWKKRFIKSMIDILPIIFPNKKTLLYLVVLSFLILYPLTNTQCFWFQRYSFR